MRILGMFAIITGGVMGCEFQDPCVLVGSQQEFGTDHLQKITLVSDHVKKLGLATAPEEVALSLGAAYAVSQIEGGQAGVPVNICFRAGRAGETEYRVLSTQGKLLLGWQSTSANH